MTWNPHVTVSTVVARGNEFLLVRERTPEGLKYNQPAGHLEPGETLFDAARRETLEESGWEVELTGFVGMSQYWAPANGETYIRTTFAAEPRRHCGDGALDAVIDSVHWLTLEQVQALGHELRSPMVLRDLQRAIASPPLPLECVDTAFALGGS